MDKAAGFIAAALIGVASLLGSCTSATKAGRASPATASEKGCAADSSSSSGHGWHGGHGMLTASEQAVAARVAHREVNRILRVAPSDAAAWQCSIDSVIAAKLDRRNAERSGLIGPGQCPDRDVILVRVVGMFTHMVFDGVPGSTGTPVPGGRVMINIAVDPDSRRKCFDSGSPFELPALHNATVIYRK